MMCSPNIIFIIDFTLTYGAANDDKVHLTGCVEVFVISNGNSENKYKNNYKSKFKISNIFLNVEISRKLLKLFWVPSKFFKSLCLYLCN